MALLPALLLLLLPLAALAAALAAVLLGLPSYDIPPGVNQPAKLRLVLAVLLGTAALVSRSPRRADGFGGREGVSSRAGGGGYTVPQVRPRRGPPAVRVGRHPPPHASKPGPRTALGSKKRRRLGDDPHAPASHGMRGAAHHGGSTPADLAHILGKTHFMFRSSEGLVNRYCQPAVLV